GPRPRHLRERRQAPGGAWEAAERAADWDAARTAVIVCDMWDDHYCKSAAQRVGVLVPPMNRVLTAARGHGVLVVHAPSGTMDRYAGTPHRRRAQPAKPPQPPLPLDGGR